MFMQDLMIWGNVHNVEEQIIRMATVIEYF
jgi:hypothetical protein